MSLQLASICHLLFLYIQGHLVFQHFCNFFLNFRAENEKNFLKSQISDSKKRIRTLEDEVETMGKSRLLLLGLWSICSAIQIADLGLRFSYAVNLQRKFPLP